MKKKNLSNLKLNLGKKRISNLDALLGGASKTANGGHETCCMSCVNWTEGKDCKVEEKPADHSPADH